MLEVPAGYGRGVRLGALFTMWIAAPLVLVVFPLAIAVVNVTGAGPFHPLDKAGLEQAGRFPAMIVLEHGFDGLQHIAFFVPFLAVTVAIARRWPARAALLFFFSATSLLFGWAKTLIAINTVNSLGAQYLAADAAGKTAVLAAGTGYDGIYSGLQSMDTYPIVLAFVLVALLPAESGLSRWIRGLGWILVVALGVPFDNLLGLTKPIFFLAGILVLPAFLILLGRWLRRLPVATTPDTSRIEGRQQSSPAG
jgi:hypothetical protein